ncbi:MULTISPECIES: hypothetical protein [unclassified Shewanella]|uniref:hypothetical protein n=2 Tax=Shewanella TaxID=22 RepID=UPI000C81C0CB|nr:MULTISPECIES: hypothetical protein [unclassified Shewanella]MDO6640973.1 hypothetical protein [Shewanella sp. 5_MG-2023]MDO6679201.1 hypothetical protein [Shewanella sp. 4_MG-2023]MDO6776502.1 hypothetical protein [Shewanella sp. 3_MG-2023]PMG30707.1 hypothetical protein BCU94_02095 [Shewanella sp. 10N.286.52.C2]PMG43606.1 hypothetical protein BCU91_04830 [Shewanella sp. 10N.286.52.B9]
MNGIVDNKLKLYQLTVIFSLLFSLMGFSYNVWRMEITEHNSNVRTASFEMLLELAQLEQLVYAAHYDNDTELGNPRVGWVKVGLIEDLSSLTNDQVRLKAQNLTLVWSEQWQQMLESEAASMEITAKIDLVRAEIKRLLVSLN